MVAPDRRAQRVADHERDGGGRRCSSSLVLAVAVSCRRPAPGAPVGGPPARPDTHRPTRIGSFRRRACCSDRACTPCRRQPPDRRTAPPGRAARTACRRETRATRAPATRWPFPSAAAPPRGRSPAGCRPGRRRPRAVPTTSAPRPPPPPAGTRASPAGYTAPAAGWSLCDVWGRPGSRLPGGGLSFSANRDRRGHENRNHRIRRRCANPGSEADRARTRRGPGNARSRQARREEEHGGHVARVDRQGEQDGQEGKGRHASRKRPRTAIC